MPEKTNDTDKDNKTPPRPNIKLDSDQPPPGNNPNTTTVAPTPARESKWEPTDYEINQYARRQFKALQHASLAAATWSRFASKKSDPTTILPSRPIIPSIIGKSSMNISDVVTTTHEVAKRSKATKERTKQLAAFVPDFILTYPDGQKIPYLTTHEAVVLMADVSGFTALTEQYSLKGQGGTDQLTKTLSSYMGPLAECMLRAGGDIIKYAGDAILAVWKVYDVKNYPQEIERTTDCALYIQEKCGVYETDVGVTIRVKLGIGAGRIHQSGIGNQEFHHFVCFGPGVQAASDAEKHCQSGDVILAQEAWDFIEPTHFTFIPKEDDFIKVFSIEKFVNEDLRGRPVTNPTKSVRQTKALTNFDPNNQIRPAIFTVLEKKSIANLEHRLRAYVIPPVLKKLDDDTPLGYLNESRNTSICFIKIDLKPFDINTPFGETMMTIVQQAFKHIYKSCTILQGCLSKIIMFDKGLTYLVVFGLPGYIHDNQSAHALKFAFRVKGQLNSIKHVSDVSLGVTSGGTYCGVLGHHLRQEYTVIGRFVNIAARLMCYYPGKVTCDQDTLYHSKLPVNHFSLMEVKQLKGIKNAGNIYEYLGAEAGEDQTVRAFEYPMVGRDGELTFFRKLVDGAILEFEKFVQVHRFYHQEYDLRNPKEFYASGLWILVYEGDIGVGKSRLLSACIQDCEERGVKVFSVSMNALVGAQRMYAIQSLLLQAFGMDDMRTSQEREEHLRKAVGEDSEIASSLCLLNDLFHLKFPTHTKFTGADINSRHVLAQHVLSLVLRHFFPKDLVVFVVDDAHLVDAIGWEYLQQLSKSPTVLSLVSIRRNMSGSPRLPDSITKIIYHNKNVKTVRLQGIAPEYSLVVACQAMEVSAIPLELEKKIIMSKSKGIPAWIEQVLKEMLRTGLLRITARDLSVIATRNLKMSEVDRQYITRIPARTLKGRRKMFDYPDDEKSVGVRTLFKSKSEGQLSIQSSIMIQPIRVQKEDIKPESRMCVVKSNTNLGSTPIPGSLKEILLDAFDELEASEQMLLKCASVLGLRFSRAMLIRVVPTYEVNSRKYEFGFRHLLESGVLKCASGKGARFLTSHQNQLGIVECSCRFTKQELATITENDDSRSEIPEMEMTKPKYYNCKYMQFAKENMIEVIYELLTEDQRRELHMKAAKYLDTSTVLCRLHGGDAPEYQFGFQLKTGELGGDNEEALRAAAAFARPGKKRSNPNQLKDPKEKNKNKNRKGSLFARIDGLKKMYKDGSKVADIEFDILKGLTSVQEKSDIHKQRRSLLKHFKCFQKQEDEYAKEWDFTVNQIKKLRRQNSEEEEEEEQGSNLKTVSQHRQESSSGSGEDNQDNQSPRGSGSGAGNRNSKGSGSGGGNISSKGSGSGRIKEGSGGSGRDGGNRSSKGSSKKSLASSLDDGVSRGRSSTIDLRGCECANLQAKLCIEMVKHYRKAEKYGKCLSNLLDAAESAITTGNSGLAMIHLEDAVALLKAIKNNEFPAPDENDADDCKIDQEKVNVEIDFLNGLSCFELGAQHKAREYFCMALEKMGHHTPGEDDKVLIEAMIIKATSALWRRHNLQCCYNTTIEKDDIDEKDKRIQTFMRMKLRTLSYLHKLYRNEKRQEMALLAALWQANAAEEFGGSFIDILPAYCSMMEIYSVSIKHAKAEYYEDLALNLLRDTFALTKQQELIGLLTSADLFNTIAEIRLVRGDVSTSTEAAYLSLRIAQAIHDNAMSTHVLPLIIKSLMFGLRISEMIDALQTLWYISEEDEDWGGIASYYALCLDLLLNTAYPLEPFYTCENFVNNSDWDADVHMYRQYEIQYNMEASLALWYCRFNHWDEAHRWKFVAESHRPVVTTFLSVSAELKLLETCLILVSHYLDSKRYQHFARSRNTAKELMRILKKSTKSIPVFQSRYEHLMAYYCRIRNRNKECDKHLRQAEATAELHSNHLELEWISHNRKVWTETAIPTLKFFWLEHIESHQLDWHMSGKVPWTNIMYSLPLPNRRK